MTLVSVLISAFNAGAWLEPSVRSALNQEGAELEVIVVDDGSTDGSVDELRLITDKRLKFLHQGNAGKAVALNRALELAEGAFYCILDADDLMHPLRVARQAAVLGNNPDVAAVFCGHELLLRGKRVAPVAKAKDRRICRDDIESYRMPAHDPTVMYRRSMVEDFSYNADLLVGQGFDHVLRVGEVHPMLVLGECLYTYRVHSASNTRKAPRYREACVQKIVEQSALRRGQPAPSSPTRPLLRDRVNNNLPAHFMESVVDLRNKGRWMEALKTGAICSRLDPLHPHYQKAILYALIPAHLRRALRRSERVA